MHSYFESISPRSLCSDSFCLGKVNVVLEEIVLIITIIFTTIINIISSVYIVTFIISFIINNITIIVVAKINDTLIMILLSFSL